jgi:hypothetical protein
MGSGGEVVVLVDRGEEEEGSTGAVEDQGNAAGGIRLMIGFAN